MEYKELPLEQSMGSNGEFVLLMRIQFAEQTVLLRGVLSYDDEDEYDYEENSKINITISHKKSWKNNNERRALIERKEKELYQILQEQAEDEEYTDGYLIYDSDGNVIGFDGD